MEYKLLARGACFAVAVLLASNSPAAPVISSAVSDGGSGNQFVLRGTGFGYKAKPGPALWDTVSNQAAYGVIASGASVPAGSGYPWKVNTYNKPGSVVFTNSFLRYSGAKFHYRTSGYDGDLDWPNALGGTSAPANQRKVYASFWIRPDASIDGSAHSSKFFRIWDKSDSTGTGGAWTQMHFTYNDWTGESSVSWSDWGGRTAAWNRLELYVNADTHELLGVTNGVIRHNEKNFKKDPSAESTGLSVARLGWDRGGTSAPSVNLTFGDIYIDTTPARVELCTKPTWDLCREREVQIATTWKDTEVRFNLEPRSLANATALYVYVIDENNVASSKGVAIGASAELEPKPPAALIVD